MTGVGLAGQTATAGNEDALRSIQYGLDGRKVGGEIAAWARGQVALLSHLDDRWGGKLFYPLAQINLSLLQNLLHVQAASGEDERELRLALAHMASQTGWFAKDAEQLDLAVQHFRFGIEMARSVENSDFAAYCLMRLGDVAIASGHPDQALSYLAAAELEAGAGSPLRSLILSFAVETQGMLGDPEGAKRMLAKADEVYEQRDVDRVPEWLYWVRRPSLMDRAPRAFISHNPHFAAKLLEDGILNVPADQVRNRMYSLVQLSIAKRAAGDMEEALTTATEVLQTVSVTPMPSVEKHLFAFYANLPGDPATDDFKERFEDYVRLRKARALHS